MPEHNPVTMGGTMRLGRRTTRFVTDDSIVKKLYGNVESIDERHRHRYEVNPTYIEEYEKAGMKFVGHSDDNKRMEILELENHPYFVAVQYHPEYISRPLKPSAPYLGLIWVNK
jgi:CTP synthase